MNFVKLILMCLIMSFSVIVIVGLKCYLYFNLDMLFLFVI